jgi:xanthine dehydrogenase accessory factor
VEAVFEAIIECLKGGRQGALATVIAAQGSVPGRVGARLFVDTEGHSVGTIGGGRLEHVVLEALTRVLETGRAERFARHLTRDLGMCCGGSVELFLEPIVSRPRLLLFGAGHVAKATAEAAKAAGFRVQVVDDRDEWNSAERFDGCERVACDPAEALRRRKLELSANDFVVITTHDHGLDESVALEVLRGQFAYVGLIGSERKARRIKARLLSRSAEGALPVERLRCPIGLSIGAETPEEIAVSIVAELVQERRKHAPALRVVEQQDITQLGVVQGRAEVE